MDKALILRLACSDAARRSLFSDVLDALRGHPRGLLAHSVLEWLLQYPDEQVGRVLKLLTT